MLLLFVTPVLSNEVPSAELPSAWAIRITGTDSLGKEKTTYVDERYATLEECRADMDLRLIRGIAFVRARGLRVGAMFGDSTKNYLKSPVEQVELECYQPEIEET